MDKLMVFITGMLFGLMIFVILGFIYVMTQ